jgi:hypothetical protein
LTENSLDKSYLFRRSPNIGLWQSRSDRAHDFTYLATLTDDSRFF